MREDEWWNEWTRESEIAAEQSKRRIRIMGYYIAAMVAVPILGIVVLILYFTQ